MAVSGRAQLHDYLRGLGAAAYRIAPCWRSSKRPLASGRWAGAVDSVGGDTLAGSCDRWRASQRRGLRPRGRSGLEYYRFPVHPARRAPARDRVERVPGAQRREIWTAGRDLPLNLLDKMIHEEPLEKVFELGEQILSGKIRAAL